MLLEVRWETKSSFLVSTEIVGFLSIFKKSQASSPFEPLNSVRLARCKRDVRPPVQKRRRLRAFSRDCTEDLDITLSREIKDEPAFKQLQGKASFF